MQIACYMTYGGVLRGQIVRCYAGGEHSDSVNHFNALSIYVLFEPHFSSNTNCPSFIITLLKQFHGHYSYSKKNFIIVLKFEINAYCHTLNCFTVFYPGNEGIRKINKRVLKNQEILLKPHNQVSPNHYPIYKN